MASTITIKTGGTTSNDLTVDPTSKALRATWYDASGDLVSYTNGASYQSDSSIPVIAGINDSTIRPIRVDRSGFLEPGFDVLLFKDAIEGSTLNTQIWTSLSATFTQAQTAAAGIRLNNGASVTASAWTTLVSQKQFWKTIHQTLRLRLKMRVIWNPNVTCEFGFSNQASNTVQVPTGWYWRYSSSGVVKPVFSFGGNDVVTGADISTLLSNTSYYTWGIIMDDDDTTFTCQNSNTGEMISEQVLKLPVGAGKTISATHIPLTIRLYNSAVAPAVAGDAYVSDVSVIGLDINQTRQWTYTQAALGLGGELSPTAYTQLANWANSAAPTTLSNGTTLVNTAAGYSTPGGLFAFNAVANTTPPTDYPLFAYTVPSPYSHYCTGVQVSIWNTGATNSATVPTTLTWFALNNASTTNLSSTVAGFTHIGSTTIPISSVAGTAGTRVNCPFEVPLRTEPGNSLIIVMQITSGATTASQVIAGMVTVRGYHE